MELYTSLLVSYKSYLTLKNYSAATKRSYISIVTRFFKWHHQLEQGQKLSCESARQYFLLLHDAGKKWRTINAEYSALLLLYKFVLHQPWDIEQLPRPKTEQPLPTIFSEQEVKNIIQAGASLKAQVFMLLLYATGLRLSEALHLTIADIDGQRKQLHVVRGKGHKSRYVHIPDDLLEVLRHYYRFYRPEHFLFNGLNKGTMWHPRSAQQSIMKAKKAAGVLKTASAHTFRHTYATHHLENGSNLVYLKQQMGHKCIKTTARYIVLCPAYRLKVSHPISQMQIAYQMPHPSDPCLGTMEKPTLKFTEPAERPSD